MKSRIQELFDLIDNGDLGKLKAELTPVDTQTRNRMTLWQVDYSYDALVPCRRIQHQDYYLLHQAVRKVFVPAVVLILEKGGDLSQAEAFEDTYYSRKNSYCPVVEEKKTTVRETALTLIEKSGSDELVQIAFDHICVRKLYLELDKPQYLKFIYDHLSVVNLSCFNASCLCFDVGKPLPRNFETGFDLKQFLIGKGFVLTGLFFIPDDYLRHFVRSAASVSAALLSHALTVCQFSLEETQHIYGAFKTDEMKTIIVDHNPEVDPEFAANLASQREEAAEARRRAVENVSFPSLKRSEIPDEKPVTPAKVQKYQHFQRRVPFLEGVITRLARETRRTKDQKNELEASRTKLAKCKTWLSTHPQYKPDADEEQERAPKRTSHGL